MDYGVMVQIIQVVSDTRITIRQPREAPEVYHAVIIKIRITGIPDAVMPIIWCFGLLALKRSGILLV